LPESITESLKEVIEVIAIRMIFRKFVVWQEKGHAKLARAINRRELLGLLNDHLGPLWTSRSSTPSFGPAIWHTEDPESLSGHGDGADAERVVNFLKEA
jgi:hypothetical protein